MHGEKLFSTGIQVWYGYAGSGNFGWFAKVAFGDLGHCNRGSVRGEITTKYGDTLSYAIDTIKMDVETLGIEFYHMEDVTPSITYVGDGEWDDFPPPDGWRETLRAEAKRIGFLCPYREAE